jgi:hypothetical protein
MKFVQRSLPRFVIISAVLLLLGTFPNHVRNTFSFNTVQAAGTTIPRSGWSLLSVDSQEIVCGNYAAVNSFDGNPATFWHTQFCPSHAVLPHDIQINLGATYSISGFSYLPRQDGCSHGWISQYQFYVSADGVNWGNPVSSGTLNYGSAVTGCPGASVPPAIQVLFPSTSAHYVQLRALSEITGGPSISMAELNLVAGSTTATLSSVALNPTTVTTGSTSQGTVTLSAAAPSSGAVITLSSSNTAAATLPASVSVAAGATSASFTVSTGSVSTPASSTISASYSGLTVTASLTINPAPTVSSLAVNPSSVVGGNSALGTVMLSSAAPASGAVVSLTSNNPVAASVPANVSIAGGANTASFAVSTSAVANTTTVMSSASYGGATATATLSVQAVGTNTAIPQSGWSLLSVDSQETVCGNYAAVRSFDGNASTFWHTQICPTTPGTPHNIQINLGATYNISGFTYLPRQDGCSHGWISQYQFYVSADGVNWGNPVSSGTLNYGSAVTGCPGASVPPAIQVLFPSTSAHYVQLRALSEIKGGAYISMAELNVLSSGGSTGGLPPTVSITSPAAGAAVSGTITVSASASDNVGVANVQLQVDGTNVGAVDTTSPYNFSLNTTTLTNGSHSLTAAAVDSSGNHATSIAVPITVSNQGTGAAVPTYANNGAGCPINTVAGGPTDAVTRYNCPLPNPTGAGNLLIVWMRYSNNNAPNITISDNVGNSYTQAASCSDTSNGNTVSRLYYAQNVKAGANLVTAAFSASSSYVQMQPYEFYNVATTAALDQAVCQASSGTSISAGLLPGLGASGDLVVQFGLADNGVAIGSCSAGVQSNIAWTMRAALIAGPEPMCFQYGVYGGIASFSPAMTFNTSVSYVSLAAAFKAAAAGTPPPSGIRVAYVQHDDGGSSLASSIGVELPVSGNLIAEVYTAGCGSNTLSSCNYATGFADGTNAWAQVGPTFMSSSGSSQESVGQIWYAKNARPGLYPISIPMNRETGINFSFPDSWIMYDIVGASSNPLDLAFGGAGNGLASASVNQVLAGSGGPFVSFTATPSAANEVILATVGSEWDTYTGLTSPAGAQFLSANYVGETNYSWCDLNGGWGLLYNGSSTAAETWTWTHDTSQGPGAGRGVALGVAFQPTP